MIVFDISFEDVSEIPHTILADRYERGEFLGLKYYKGRHYAVIMGITKE